MANRFTLEMDTGNAAFDDGTGGRDEIATILRRVADMLEVGTSAGPLFDSNGNRVGKFESEIEPDRL